MRAAKPIKMSSGYVVTLTIDSFMSVSIWNQTKSMLINVKFMLELFNERVFFPVAPQNVLFGVQLFERFLNGRESSCLIVYYRSLNFSRNVYRYCLDDLVVLWQDKNK